MRITASLFSLALLSSSAGATEWLALGPRAVAMGGAGVAVADGPVGGSYWNPASLALPTSPSGVEIPIGADIQVTGTALQGANDLNQIGNSCSGGGGNGTCTQANITNALAAMNQPGSGVKAGAAFGSAIKVKSISVFAQDFLYVGAMPRVDMNPADDTPAALSAGTNASKLVVRGISITEIGASYGHAVPYAPGLMAGVALKGMIGKVGYTDFRIFSKSAGTSSSLSHFLDGSKQSFQPGIDLGLLYDPTKADPVLPLHPMLGVTARDINSPRFDQPAQALGAGQAGHFSVNGSVRAGLSISPFSFWHIAADADLTRNTTIIDGLASRVLAFGTEIDVFNRPWLNIPLRLGVSQNTAQSGSKASLSGGIGLNIMHVHFDLGASATPATQSIQTQGSSKKLPTSAGVAAELAVLF